MKVKEGFVVREVADMIVAVPTGSLLNEYRGMITLSKVGEFVWNLLEEGITEQEIIDKVMRRYHIDQERAKKDTKKFLDNLRTKKILIEE